MKCVHCETELEEKFYYITIGSLKIDTQSEEQRASMFQPGEAIPHFTLGVHDHEGLTEDQAKIEMKSYDPRKSHMDLIENNWDGNGQADLIFCSKDCLTDWFLSKIDKIKTHSGGA